MTPINLATTIGKHFEGCDLDAYPDSGGVWTIGRGTTRYPNGTAVKQGDKCTQSDADLWFANDYYKAYQIALAHLKVKLSDNRLAALIDSVYNGGVQQALFDRINTNQEDKAIWGEFIRYDHDSEGKVQLGLLRRTNCRANLYFLGTFNFFDDLKV